MEQTKAGESANVTKQNVNSISLPAWIGSVSIEIEATGASTPIVRHPIESTSIQF